MTHQRGSFFRKLFLGNLLLVGVVIAASCAVSYRYLDAEYQQRDEAYQRQLVGMLGGDFEQTWSQDSPSVDSHCKGLMRDLPFRLTVIAADGRVLGDSQADPRTMVNHKTSDRPEIMAALAGRSALNVHTSETLGIPFRYLAQPIRRDGAVVGVVRVAMPVQAIVEGHHFIRNAMLWAAAAAVAAAVVLGLLLSWLWYRPLRQIVHVAGKIADGNLAFRPRITGSGELAQLGSALNEMRLGLARQIQTIATQRENLSAVIAGLREGVVALDAERRIVLMNRSAVELLAAGAEDVAGKHIQSAVRLPEIIDALDELRDGRSLDLQFEAEMKDGKRLTLDLHVARVGPGGQGGIRHLLVVRDVTEFLRVAAVKAEFVANASHELRTPLATIRAAVDSLAALEPGDRDGAAKCLEILDRHVRRLENMTNDLLDLHLVEQARRKLLLEDVPLETLARWCRGQFEAQAGEKGVALAVETPRADAQFRTDRTLMQLILQNLLDNGVKFTPSGGKVTCRLAPDDGGLVLQVADTGIGIPQEMKTRVFERFFQVDSARGGGDRARGTGLGLAIVKHAAERLGAKIQLETALGRGTTVTVTIPAVQAV